jgi:hypothetical protein
VHIHFTPDTHGGAACGGGLYGSLPDEVLLHEMVHGLRDMQGQSFKVPTRGTLRNYDNLEEFLAIVITNVYISAKDKTMPLRADHHGHTRLKDTLSTSEGFLKNPENLRLLSLLNTKFLEGPLFEQLGFLVPSAAFNPFRELLVHPEKY